jgi:hypothetical protein
MGERHADEPADAQGAGARADEHQRERTTISATSAGPSLFMTSPLAGTVVRCFSNGKATTRALPPSRSSSVPGSAPRWCRMPSPIGPSAGGIGYAGGPSDRPRRRGRAQLRRREACRARIAGRTGASARRRDSGCAPRSPVRGSSLWCSSPRLSRPVSCGKVVGAEVDSETEIAVFDAGASSRAASPARWRRSFSVVSRIHASGSRGFSVAFGKREKLASPGDGVERRERPRCRRPIRSGIEP